MNAEKINKAVSDWKIDNISAHYAMRLIEDALEDRNNALGFIYRNTRGEFGVEMERWPDLRPKEVMGLFGEPSGREEKCMWTENDDPDFMCWGTACGETWAFTEGGPTENGVKFCPYCGGEVKLPPSEPSK